MGIEDLKCIANDCQKWVDEARCEEKCPHRFKGKSRDTCEIPTDIDCNDCPHRYGRCCG